MKEEKVFYLLQKRLITVKIKKELQEIQEFESLQKKVLTCEGSKRILQQKGSRSQEPVEIRLLSQGARIERKINEIRNQQFQTLKQAAPKIDKKSARIMNEKIHGSFHQRYFEGFRSLRLTIVCLG